MNADEAACPACAETIKRAAKVCRYCSLKIDADPSSLTASQHAEQRGFSFLGYAIVALALSMLFGVTFLLWSQATRVSERPEVTSLIERGQASIAHDLLDPSSAQFREVKAISRCIVGEVNAKNRFGAYTGFKNFYYDSVTEKSETQPDISDLNEWGAFNSRRSTCMTGRS